MSSGGREVPTALRNHNDHQDRNMLLCQTVDLERDFDNIYEELLEDLALLGDIRVQDNQDNNEDGYDLLLFPDFCRINKLIKKYTHPTMVPSLNLLTQQRRSILDVDEA